MADLTSAQILNLLRRANCCFADKAYESTKIFAIGNFDKGFCEFEKIEALYHYINALRCFIPDGEEVCADTVPACVSPPPYNIDPVNTDYELVSFTINGITYNPVVTGSTGIEFMDNFVAAINDIGLFSATYVASELEAFLVVCALIGEEGNSYTFESVNTYESPGGPILYGVLPVEFSGGSGPDPCTTWDGDNNCLSEENKDILIERIEDQCGCCSCVSFDYELTKDTL